jgi:hypothetical protein
VEQVTTQLRSQQTAFEKEQHRKLDDIHQAYRLTSDRLREFEVSTAHKLERLDEDVTRATRLSQELMNAKKDAAS